MLSAKDHAFVVCAYKENSFLEETVISLLDQTVLGDVIISTSTPNALIEGVAKKYNIPVVVNPAPHLAGDDWNYGYDAADAKLVTLAHQDDWYERNYLETILDAANEYDQAQLSLVFTDYYELRNGENIANNRLLAIKRLMNAPFKHRAINGSRFAKKLVLGFGDSICCPAVTYAKCNLGNSIFDTTYKNSCDYKTFVDLAREKGRFVYIPEKLVGHRIYEESATTLNLAEDIRKKEDAEILETLWPRPIAKAINSVYALSEKSNDL